MLFLPSRRSERGILFGHLHPPPVSHLAPVVRSFSASWPIWEALEIGEVGAMTHLQLFIWSVVLVSSGQIYLIARYLLWPRIHRITHCPWCWRDAGIMNGFPAPWSSTICSFHDRQIRTQSAARRLARQQATQIAHRDRRQVRQEVAV